MDPVAGSVVLITGASRGLGVGVTQAFARVRPAPCGS